MIISTLTDGELFLEVLEGIKLMGSVKFFIILAMTALDFSVMSGGIGADQLVTNTEAGQFSLKSGRSLLSFI